MVDNNLPICYNKNDNDYLFNDFKDKVDVEEIQNYIPIYNRFFSLNENNNDKINLVLLNKIGKATYNYQFKVPIIYKFLNKELIN